MIYHETEYFTVHFDLDRSLILINWDGFVTSEQYREGMTVSLRLAMERNARNLIANAKTMKVIRLHDQEWTVNEYLPRFNKTNIQKVATVLSEDIFNQISVKNILSSATGSELIDYDIKYFNRLSAAMQWIEN